MSRITKLNEKRCAMNSEPDKVKLRVAPERIGSEFGGATPHKE